MGNSDTAQVGDWLKPSAAFAALADRHRGGIISPRTAPSSPRQRPVPALHPDRRRINPATPRPLLNMNGEVIGVNTRHLHSVGRLPGIGFAMPSNTVVDIYNDSSVPATSTPRLHWHSLQ